MYEYNFTLPEIDSYTVTNGLESMAGGAMVAMFVFLIIFLMIAAAIGIVLYIFESLSIYTIAKKRGIENPWLAWIPFANLWIIGQIGDYYNAREGKPDQKLRVWTLCLGLGIFIPFFGVFSIIAAAVLSYICIYKFLKSVNPENSVLMLVLMIVFEIARPFILFAHRNKEDTAVQMPQSTYGQQYAQPYYNQPQYTQPQYTQPQYNQPSAQQPQYTQNPNPQQATPQNNTNN